MADIPDKSYVYGYPFSPMIPDYAKRFSTNTGRFIPHDVDLSDILAGVTPDYPMSDILAQLWKDRSTVLSKVPSSADVFFPPVYARTTGSYAGSSNYGKIQTPVAMILFSAAFIDKTIVRIRMSLHKIMRNAPDSFVPPPVHRADVIAFLEDEYQNGIDTSGTDPSPDNVNKTVYAISKPAIDRLIYHGLRFIQDRSKYVYQKSTVSVMPYGEDDSIHGTDREDLMSFRDNIVIQPDSMEVPYWWS